MEQINDLKMGVASHFEVVLFKKIKKCKGQIPHLVIVYKMQHCIRHNTKMVENATI